MSSARSGMKTIESIIDVFVKNWIASSFMVG
jgi:hypothetical protein